MRKLRPLLEGLGRVGEWHQIIEQLRTEYECRRSLMSILNQMDREKGGSGKIADERTAPGNGSGDEPVLKPEGDGAGSGITCR